MGEAGNLRVMRNTTFREVHKNAWLKMKKDKLWIVFCIHDDTDPFLEAYSDNKSAANHKPNWFTSLNNTLHVTPTICPQEDEYEFVITLETDVVRFAAPSWQLMIDWVETLGKKLLEMRIISPKENVYSKLPENKNVMLLPTRDPTSPLPPPPQVPAAILPGVEAPLQPTTVFFTYDTASIASSSSSQPPSMLDLTPSTAHYEQLFLQSTQLSSSSSSHPPPPPTPAASLLPPTHPVIAKVALLKRAQRSVSNCERQQTFLHLRAANELALSNNNNNCAVRRRSNSLSSSSEMSQSSASTTPINQMEKRMTLRAQQVHELRKEIAHPAGIRLKLRRRDCVKTIALVDAFNSIWIAGWKQKEHPILYNALHIGDRLMSVDGVQVMKTCDANRILRLGTGFHIELVVKRIPMGQVFAIRRDNEGQSLGLLQEDGSAVIKDILTDGLAARHGLPPKALALDGVSLTNWVLTEINGRPLNFFFKDNEIRDRLQSVGRDISILVQPLDFIKQLKKQLKSIKNYKEYLLQ